MQNFSKIYENSANCQPPKRRSKNKSVNPEGTKHFQLGHPKKMAATTAINCYTTYYSLFRFLLKERNEKKTTKSQILREDRSPLKRGPKVGNWNCFVDSHTAAEDVLFSLT